MPPEIREDALPTLPDGSPVAPELEVLPQASVPTPPDGPGELQEPEPEPAPVETPAAELPTEAEVLDILGQNLPVAEVRALLEFRQWASENPQLMAGFNDVLTGRARFAPVDEPIAPAPVTPVPAGPAPILSEDDLADLPEAVRAKLGRIDSLEAMFGEFQQNQQREQQARNGASVDAAARAFGRKFDLNEQEVQEVAASVARAGHLLPGYIQSNQGDVERGTLAAFEATYLSSPQGLQRELDRRERLNRDDLERKRKASKLGGSSGVIPRSPEPAAAENTPASRRLAIANDIAAQLRGE